MILLDSLYINNGGGRILLNYLVNKLTDNDFNVFFLFDERCKGDYEYIPSERKIFLKASLVNRNKFYKNNEQRFTKVLCFGNLGPSIKMKVPVYTYFHQTIYLKIPDGFTLNNRLLFKIKSILFSRFLKNTDFLCVQSNLIKTGIENKYKFKSSNILLLPFYPNEDLKNENVIRKSDSYIFVSTGMPHKNHVRLINAFCKFFDESKRGKLYLTVDPSIFVDLCNFINKKIDLGYPIVNLGFIKREDLIKRYNKTEYLFFPSLEESFGLGIVEAIECGCKVIGANLPYMFQVCEPSITFDPFDEMSMYNAFIDSTKDNVVSTRQIIKNEINQLINLLK